MTDSDIVIRLQSDALFFGTRHEPLLVDDKVCREMAVCWEQAADEIERLRKEVADAYSKSAQVLADLSANLCTASALERERLTAERDEARRLLKAVVDMMRDNMAHDATHPHHLCDFIHRPDIGMCKVCEDWTDAMVMCYPDDFQDEEDGK